jgi:hypothetical protein
VTESLSNDEFAAAPDEVAPCSGELPVADVEVSPLALLPWTLVPPEPVVEDWPDDVLEELEPVPGDVWTGIVAGVEITYVTPLLLVSMLLSSWPLVTMELPVKLIGADPVSIALNVTCANNWSPPEIIGKAALSILKTPPELLETSCVL